MDAQMYNEILGTAISSIAVTVTTFTMIFLIIMSNDVWRVFIFEHDYYKKWKYFLNNVDKFTFVEHDDSTFNDTWVFKYTNENGETFIAESYKDFWDSSDKVVYKCTIFRENGGLYLSQNPEKFSSLMARELFLKHMNDIWKL